TVKRRTGHLEGRSRMGNRQAEPGDLILGRRRTVGGEIASSQLAKRRIARPGSRTLEPVIDQHVGRFPVFAFGPKAEYALQRGEPDEMDGRLRLAIEVHAVTPQPVDDLGAGEGPRA